MTHDELRSLILKRWDELYRSYDREYPMQTNGVTEQPRTAAGFRRWLRAEIAALADDSPNENLFWEAGDTIRAARRIAIGLDRPDVAKICRIRTGPLALPVAQEILSACLQSLRKRRPADLPSDLLTPPQVAQRYGVSPDTVRGWIASGQLPAVNVGKGSRPRFRISADALREFDAKRPPKVVPTTRSQRHRRANSAGLIVTRYSSGR